MRKEGERERERTSDTETTLAQGVLYPPHHVEFFFIWGEPSKIKENGERYVVYSPILIWNSSFARGTTLTHCTSHPVPVLPLENRGLI